jgi:hypothetical protein
MAANFISLAPKSLTASAATKISSTQLFAASVVIYADNLNTGNVYLGGSNVTVSNGIPLSKNQSQNISYELVFGTNGKIDLSTIYMDTDTTGNLVRITYVQWDGF